MKKKFRIYLNAPITLGFVIVCCLVMLLDHFTLGRSTTLAFSTYGSSLLRPMTYIRLIGHVFGHASLSHLINNMLYILLLGPILEEKYHEKLIYVIIVTALVTGIAHNILSPNTMLLGASGIVFAFILLASITGNEEGIPLTLIIVAIMWIGGEIYDSVSTVDNISQITHIIGGISGSIMGMTFKKK